MDNKEMVKKVNSVILCLMAHPNNEPDSEFADRIDDLIEVKESLVKNNVVLADVSHHRELLIAYQEYLNECNETYLHQHEKVIDKYLSKS